MFENTPILIVELLKVLMEMRHRDEIVIERFALYERIKKAYVAVMIGVQKLYAYILLRKDVAVA
jgi:L-fucose mutarotase/ribose pyranase (RbsD/FucU family)